MKQVIVVNEVLKIVLACPSEVDLRALHSLATKAQIAASLIQDAGKTVLPTGTTTALGLGPAATDKIDKLTRTMKLL